jgi:nucleoside phosphorylase
MVINKEGYFENRIKTINRKTAAVEMESYGVARACDFANDGQTIPIIFKSVMDNTHKKEDKAKRFAAYTSAQLLKQLFDKGII